MNAVKYWTTLLPFILITAGCATAPKPQVPLRPGATLETVSAMVSISVKAPQGSTGGHGYMLYKKPDRFHLVMLTPFGTTALETFSADDRLTILIPSKGTAYSGSFTDMPENSPLRGWRMIKLMAVDQPLFDPGKKGIVEKSGEGSGEITSWYDDTGLLTRKRFATGEEVFFRDYQSADGVPFPSVVEFTDGNGSRVKITFDEPEINKPVEDAALTPNLEGITILPLISIKGI
ncbi:MAG TPA: outer membrane lipoprotein LolB [Geobacteraceae bacterium]|nr:outer membrane lipoprotein LolB [Geobacteraceae bacterium]